MPEVLRFITGRCLTELWAYSQLIKTEESAFIDSEGLIADLADFRRFFTNIVQKDPDFLERKMKVCDACCTRFYAAADDSMSIEMTKLVVGTPGDTSMSSTLRQSKKSSLGLISLSRTSPKSCRACLMFREI